MKQIPYKTIAAAAFILTVLMIPGSQAPTVPRFPHADKFAHAALFSLLALAAATDYRPMTRTRLGLCIAGAALFAALTELLQLTMRSRSADLVDWLADMAGFIITGLFMYFFARKRS